MISDSELDESCETESVYNVTVPDLEHTSFQVKIYLGEKTVQSELTEVITIQVSDVLTKSLYEGIFDSDDIGRMGSFIDLDKVFVVLQASLSSLKQGSDSTANKIEFGYIETPEARNDEQKNEVFCDRKSMARAKRTLKKKYTKLNKDSSGEKSLIITVRFSSELLSEFYVFPLVITNKDDETGRLVSMMKDRKSEIDETRENQAKLQDHLVKVTKQLAALEVRSFVDEGKESGRDLKMAEFNPSGNMSGSGAYAVWDQCSFDFLGAQYVQRKNSNQQVNIVKAGFYRIESTMRLYGSTETHLCLSVNGTAVFYAYGFGYGANASSSPYLSHVAKLNSGDYIQIQCYYNNTGYGGKARSFLRIEFLQPA